MSTKCYRQCPISRAKSDFYNVMPVTDFCKCCPVQRQYCIINVGQKEGFKEIFEISNKYINWSVTKRL